MPPVVLDLDVARGGVHLDRPEPSAGLEVGRGDVHIGVGIVRRGDAHLELVAAGEAEALAVLDDDLPPALLDADGLDVAADRLDLDDRLGRLRGLDLHTPGGNADAELQRLWSGELVPHLGRLLNGSPGAPKRRRPWVAAVDPDLDVPERRRVEGHCASFQLRP